MAPRRVPQSRWPLNRMGGQGGLLRSAVVLAAVVLADACGDGTTEPSTPDPLVPTTVAVSPATATVVEGDTLRLTATATNVYGQVVTGAEFEWASGNTTVAAVDASGLVTGVGAGQAEVTAMAGEASGDALVTVAIDLDRVALVALYNATDGPNWVDNTNWLTDAPLGEWYGVMTDREGRVVRLELHGRWDGEAGKVVSHGLTGKMPPELGGLANLRGLDLGSNALSGAIPPELGNLANLGDLRLYENGLTGAIPPELGNLANLGGLELGDNGLTGAIPPELGNLANLRSLYLNENDLKGAIPPELGNLANLRELELRDNGLTGAIPPELGNLANLEGLHLYSNDLTGAIPPELGNLTNLESLGLAINGLTGAIPPELGNLANLEWLSVAYNDLRGAIPQSILQLDQLRGFYVRGQDVCVPGASAFLAWFDGIENRDLKAEVVCNVADVAALESLYDLADGANWTESSGWLGDGGVEDWYGVTADTLGHVTELDLVGNGLAGRLPGTLGNLPGVKVLRIGDNALDGRLPLSLTALDLDEFHYGGTNLCEPADANFQRWLEGIASRRGTGAQCAPLTERDVLTALYASTGGSGWTKSDGWLSEAPLRRWHGVWVDAQGRVAGLNLYRNELSGAIPPELGGLANLERLALIGNALSGAIPPELGDLANLEWLYLRDNALSGAIPPELANLANLWGLFLSDNALSGAIPPELANLANLWGLFLSDNALSGAIPPELGDLANLERLRLSGNALSGAIPPELGGLSNLEQLYLSNNALTGPIPATFGELANLTDLVLSHNADLAGAAPAGMLDLSLESLLASGTELCVPREAAFQEWLAGIPERWIALCDGAAAYLAQAVQSRAHPVPLVAGEDALLRVFVTAAMETAEGIPDVRARFYLNGVERHVLDIEATSTPIPTEIDEGELSKSANAEVPGWLVHEGLEMVVEIDPDGMLDASLGVPSRIPEEGRLPIEVREMPVFDLTVIPFLWSGDPDSLVVGMAEGMAADPEGHKLLEATRVLLPVADIDVTAHATVATTINSFRDVLRETEAIRVLEGGGGHYMGMVYGFGGIAYQPGRSSASGTVSYLIAHELGHNMSLGHAPCRATSALDPSFPYPRGRIGAWGYDRGGLVGPWKPDNMSYCHPGWTSDYNFTKALRHRLADEGAQAAALPAPATSLLLWGGVDTTGTPFLDPAFVANAPPALPDSAGDYTVTGRDAAGRQLFSLSFAMQVELAEDAETSSFVFALPARPGWAEALATITLSGPGGSVALDGESDIPMAILRDPQTGQVRGFLRDSQASLPTQTAADAAGSLAPGFDVLFSRGIPSAEEWRR